MEGKRVLEGWKAISAHLGRTTKTCRKWEHGLGLPVHRLDDSAGAHVFAYTDELDRWKEGKIRAIKSPFAGSRSPFRRKALFWLISASAAVALAAVFLTIIRGRISPLQKAPGAPKIENSIAVIGFENLTGDPIYDHLQKAIPNLLITNLENTGLFYVVTWERMEDVLKQTGVGRARPIDRDLGFEVCRREGIKAIVIGSFMKAGDVFRTDVKVLDAETKRLLKSANTKGTGIDSLLDTQIDTLSREVSLGLGGEKTTVEPARLDIKNITTPSLRAYEYFLEGREAYALEHWAGLKDNMGKALGIDPAFAMAYVYLAWADHFLGDLKARNETLRHAMALANRTSEKDRLYLEGAYALFIERDRDKYQSLLEELIWKYPKEKSAFHYLGDLHFEKRDYQGAVDQYIKWLALDSRDTFAINHLLMATIPRRDFRKALEYVRMRDAVAPPDTGSLHWRAVMYRKMGQVEKAIALNKEALELNPGFVAAFNNLSGLYALKEDYEESIRWADELVSRAPSAGWKSKAYCLRGVYRTWLGKFKDALADFARAEKTAEEVENWDEKADAVKWKGIVNVARGEFEPGRKCFDHAVGIVERYSPEEVPLLKARAALWMGHLDAGEGRIERAKAGLSELASLLLMCDQRTQKELKFWHDLLQGEVFLAQGALDAALPVSQKACQPGAPFQDDSRYYQDLLARVYAARGEVDKAISEYQRLFKPDVLAEAAASEYEPPRVPYGAADVVYLIHPLYHHRLGLLYESQGDVAKAKAQYKKFLDLWKDADPGRPEVEDAKRRLTALERP